ncbi:hypothetical protein BH11ACT8_BH11ACT8_11010 [soil metagenome]
MEGPDLELRVLQASPDGIFLMTLDGTIGYANQRFADIAGRRIDELVGQPSSILADDRGRADMERHLELMRAGHPGAQNEDVRVVRGDGTPVWTLASWAPAYDDDGAVLGYVHRVTEHTERRRLLDALREREVELDEAQRIARLGSWSWDVATDEVWWSDELHRMFRNDNMRQAPEFDSFLTHLHPDDRDHVSQVITAAMEHGDDFEWEARAVTDDGVLRWVRGLGVVDRGADGRVLRLRGTAQDITGLRSADEAAADAWRRLNLLQQVADAANRSTTVAEALVRAAAALRQHSAWVPVCVWVADGPDGELV